MARNRAAVDEVTQMICMFHAARPISYRLFQLIAGNHSQRTARCIAVDVYCVLHSVFYILRLFCTYCAVRTAWCVSTADFVHWPIRRHQARVISATG